LTGLRTARTHERQAPLLRYAQKDNHPGCSQQEGPFLMCDYSLHHVASRPAKVGDKLVTTRFGNAITRGFAAVGEPEVAVCLMPGTELAFETEVECDRALRFLPNWKITEQAARFRQVNMDQPCTHHDALEFADGQIILVTQLCDGQRATVLQLPASPRAQAETRGFAPEPVAAGSEPR
jgi:hypothetical protein